MKSKTPAATNAQKTPVKPPTSKKSFFSCMACCSGQKAKPAPPTPTKTEAKPIAVAARPTTSESFVAEAAPIALLQIGAQKDNITPEKEAPASPGVEVKHNEI